MKRFKKIFAIVLAVLVLFISIRFIFFKPEFVEAAWYNDSWGFRVKLTIDYTKVAADQTDFPVYVDLSLLPGSFHTHVNQTDARDIRVTTSDGSTELPREVVYYDAATDKGELHFKYSGTLSSSTNTSVYIYYGNPGASDYSASATYGKNNVWDTSYSGVHHLQSSSFADSTSGAHNGTNSNSTSATGRAGDGRLMDANGEYFYVPMSGYIHSSVNTFEWWYKNTTTPLTYSSFFNSSEGSDQLTFARNASDTTLSLNLNTTNYIDWTSLSTNVFDGNWHYIAVVLDTVGNTEELFIDGTSRGQKTQNPADIDISTYNFLWGGNTSSAQANGIIDEVKVSNNYKRSSTWISTQYNNQNSPSTFFLSSPKVEQKRSAVVNLAFDEGYGTTTYDSSVNGYNGTLSGATTPSWQPEDLCVSGKCLYYNGTTAFTSVATSVPNVQSVSFWVRPKTNGEVLVDFDGGTHRITASGGTITASGFSTPTVYVNGNSAGTLTANVWQHVEVTTATAFTASNITIGKYSTSFLNGFIDEFKVYDYARSAAQVKMDIASRNSPAGVAAQFGPDLGKTLSSGLVGYWKLEEAGDATRTDSSGNGNDLTESAADTIAQITGKFGFAGDFELGDTEYLSVADNATLSVTGNLTLSAWIKPETVSAGTYNILAKWDGVNESYRLYQSANTIVFEIESGNTVTSTTTLSAATWYHVAGVYDSSNQTAKLYINGVQEVVTASGTIPSSIGDDGGVFHIGAEDSTGGATGYYDGIIDEARVYNRAFTPAEVRQLYNWAPGPVGWWKMDENTGQSASDTSGNGNTGTLGSSGSADSADPSWEVGKYGSGLHVLNGDYLNIPDSDNYSISTTSQLTVEGWVKYNDLTGDQYTFNKRGSSNYEWYLGKNTGSTKIFVTTSGLTGTNYLSGSSTSDLVAGRWYHVAFTVDTGSTTLKLYFNGVLEMTDTTSSGGTPGNGNKSIRIGMDNDSQNNSRASVDDLRIYNYARTPGQIIEDMNAGHPAPGSPVGSALHYYKFDEGYGDTAYNAGTISVNGDLGGSGQTCPASGTVPCPTPSNDGKYSKALNFDGTDDYVAIYSPNLPVNDFTYSAWVNLDDVTQETILMAADAGGVNELNLGVGVDTDGKVDFRVNGGTPDVVSNQTISASTWTHLAVVRSSSTIYVYVNGTVDSATGSDGTTLNFGSCALLVGTDADSATSNCTSTLGEYADGRIDEVKVYNFAFTSDQIKVEYTRGSSTVLGSISTDSSGNPSNSAQREYCPPGNTEGNCGGSNDPSPVGHWKMDENTGTSTTNDSSGNGNTGTIVGLTANDWIPGKYGSALNFESTTPGDSIDISDSTPIQNIFSGGGTISSWIYPRSDGQGDYGRIIDKSADSVDGWLLAVTGESGGSVKVYFAQRYSPTWGEWTTTNTVATLNTWTHVSVSYDSDSTSNNPTIYINGQSVALTELSPSGTFAGDVGNTLHIGNRAANTRTFDGLIDEIRLYNYARTPTQIAWDYNRGAPVAWWKMDECTGDTLYDASITGGGAAGGKNGTRAGTSGTNTSSGTCTTVDTATAWYNGRTGKYNGSLDFDGGEVNADDKVTITNASAIDLNEGLQNGFTFSAWIYPDSDGEGDAGRIFDKGTNNYCKLGSESGGQATVTCIVNLSTEAEYSATTKVTIGAWNHVAFSWTNDSDDEVTIWVNGTANTSSATFEGDAAADTTDLTIGNVSAQSATFDGKIDDFRIYPYEASSQQIKTIMGEGAVRMGPASGSP